MLRVTALAFPLLLAAAAGTQAATRDWTGAGGNNLWSNGANWQGGMPPANGDTVRFPNGEGCGYLGCPAPYFDTVNDIAGLDLHTLRGAFNQSGNASIPSVKISGESLGIAASISGVVMNARVRVLADGVQVIGFVYGGMDVGGHSIQVVGDVDAASLDKGITGTGKISYSPGGNYFNYYAVRGLHSFSGTVVIPSSPSVPVYFNGEMPAAFEVTDTRLEASGAIGNLSLAGSASLKPRYPFLDTGSLLLGNGTELRIEGAHELLDVSGTVTLDSPTLTLLLDGKIGRAYVVIRNDGTDAISGTFADAPEGAVVRFGSSDYRVSYVGGDGNDFTLTALTGEAAVRNDFDRDGKADIVWQHRGGNGNTGLGTVYRMSMDGFAIASGEPVYEEPNLDWRPVARGDFDANGVTDIVWRNDATREYYMMLFGADGRPMEGSGFFHTEADPEWDIVAAPNVDGDRRSDLLWRRSSGELHVMLMDGAAIRSQNPSGMSPAGGQVVAAGDILGSDFDYVLFRSSDGAGEVMLGRFGWNGREYALLPHTTHIYSESNQDWRIIGTPDLNGDGNADILWHNEVTGWTYGMLVSYNFNTGRHALASQGYIHQADPGWVIADTGDYDGDGMDDILWHNEVDGRVHVMLMDGLSIKDQRTVYREPDTGWKPLGPPMFRAP